MYSGAYDFVPVILQRNWLSACFYDVPCCARDVHLTRGGTGLDYHCLKESSAYICSFSLACT